MGVKFTANPNFGAEFARSAEARSYLNRRVRAASDHARGISPRLFGHYQAQHVVGTASVEGGTLSQAFGNNDVDANLIEFGAKGTPAYRVLERAAQLEGFEYEPS